MLVRSVVGGALAAFTCLTQHRDYVRCAVPLPYWPETSVHFPFHPTQSGCRPGPYLSQEAPQLARVEQLRQAVRRVQRTFLVVNGIPFVVGAVVFPFSKLPTLRVFGQFTLGMAWGIAQCGLFVAMAWLHETRSVRLCDPVEQSLLDGLPQSERSGASPADGAVKR